MMLRARYFAAVPLALIVGVAACGGSEPPPVPPPPPPPASETPPPPPPTASAETPAPPPAPALPDVAFGPTTASDLPKKMPKVAIASPTSEQAVAADKAGDLPVKVTIKDWETQPGGPHVHLILDNKPYKPIFDPKAAVKLSDLVGPGEAIAEGEHLLVAFPSRMNHESVKAPGALAMVHFWVGKKGKSEFKPKEPMLIYSRPKGTYNASKAEHVLVDWYLANAELGEGKFSVKANVTGPGIDGDGRAVTIKEWKPYALENLRNGEYTVSLELEDKDGKAVPGAWNSTKRTITINRDAPEDPPMAPAMAHESHEGDAKGTTDKKGHDDKAMMDKKPAAEKKADADKKPAAEKKADADKKPAAATDKAASDKKGADDKK
jgi:hypothetical protein